MKVLNNIPFTEITLEGTYVVVAQEDEGMGVAEGDIRMGTGKEVFEYLKEALGFDQEEIDELEEEGEDWLEEAAERNEDSHVFILVYTIA